MSLIQCPECGEEFSDYSLKCPKCGYPFRIILIKKKFFIIIPKLIKYSLYFVSILIILLISISILDKIQIENTKKLREYDWIEKLYGKTHNQPTSKTSSSVPGSLNKGKKMEFLKEVDPIKEFTVSSPYLISRGQFDRLSGWDVLTAAFVQENSIGSFLNYYGHLAPMAHVVKPEPGYDVWEHIKETHYMAFPAAFAPVENSIQFVQVARQIDEELKNRKILEKVGGWE